MRACVQILSCCLFGRVVHIRRSLLVSTLPVIQQIEYLSCQPASNINHIAVCLCLFGLLRVDVVCSIVLLSFVCVRAIFSFVFPSDHACISVTCRDFDLLRNMLHVPSVVNC